MMCHPMHLHGRTFQMHTSDGSGARKDTTIVRRMQTVTVDFNADNPDGGCCTAITPTTPKPA
jgi:FtsP/CotA-like multicopper oxidase with cupredoxin domain